jgi:hypothetical protein
LRRVKRAKWKQRVVRVVVRRNRGGINQRGRNEYGGVGEGGEEK